MEKFKGVEVGFDGAENVQEFAMGILVLTNLKSSVDKSVFDFKTFEGSNLISATFVKEFFEANKSYLESHVGKITHASEVIVNEIELDDVKESVTKEIDKQMDEYLEDDSAPTPMVFLSKYTNM